jgi:hypothetical protein
MMDDGLLTGRMKGWMDSLYYLGGIPLQRNFFFPQLHHSVRTPSSTTRIFPSLSLCSLRSPNTAYAPLRSTFPVLQLLTHLVARYHLPTTVTFATTATSTIVTSTTVTSTTVTSTTVTSSTAITVIHDCHCDRNFLLRLSLSVHFHRYGNGWDRMDEYIR